MYPSALSLVSQLAMGRVETAFGKDLLHDSHSLQYFGSGGWILSHLSLKSNTYKPNEEGNHDRRENDKVKPLANDLNRFIDGDRCEYDDEHKGTNHCGRQ